MSVLDALRDNGLVVTDSRVPGRPGRTLTPLGIMLHHTASPLTSGNVPSLGVVQHGRPDVRGPLCHILIGRALSVHAITDGAANHSGGGSSAARRRFMLGQTPQRPTTVDDDTHISDLTIGIEIENDGIGEPWTAGMLERVEQVCMVLCREFSIDPASRVLGHLEWTRRKIDPTFAMPAMRTRVASGLIPGPPNGVFMALTDKEQIELLTKVRALADRRHLEFWQREGVGAQYLTNGILKWGITTPAMKATMMKRFDIPGTIIKVDAATFDRVMDVRKLVPTGPTAAQIAAAVLAGLDDMPLDPAMVQAITDAVNAKIAAAFAAAAAALDGD